MCSLFMLSTRTMDNYQAGDLTDILRGGSANGNISSNLSDHHQESRHTADTWRYPSDHPMNFSSSSSSCAHMDAEEEGNKESFGDPFSSYLRDPLLHELDLSGSPFFSSSKSSEISMDGGGVGVATTATTFGGGGLLGHHQGGIAGGDPVNKRPCNIFSRMLQISPSAKVPVSSGDSPLMGTAVPCKTSASSAMVGGNMIINGNRSSGGKGGCLLENTGMQISSPRNPGIKRRKSQAKKVVCIPAPAAANSRPTGEVVPSDLWAWRKYGQKPIKGSPYPRGYYRCSSSKGCSARKQVERSRTDPNMLVITYTSEHNHPWPTQRNALAGSTRSQPSKNAGASKTSPNTSHHHQKPSSPTKEEQNNKNDIIPNMSSDNHTSQVSPVISAGGTSTVKEEFEQVIEKQLELHHHHHQHQFNGHDDHRGGFAYRPSMPDDNQSNHHHEDFFADLGEIEADPLNLLFSQCFTADEQQKAGSKDPFNIFDWSSGDTEATATAPTATATTTTNNSNTATPFGEANKRML